MAKFDKYLTPASNMASRLVSAQVRGQAPVKTGALKRSVKVRLDRTENNGTYAFTFNYNYLGYGIFTDLGTKPYAVDDASRGPWNPKPGKGEGGIRPRFWLSLDESIQDRIGNIFTDAIIKAQMEQI